MQVVYNSLDKLYRDFLRRLPFVTAGLIVLLLTWGTANTMALLLNHFLEKRKRIRSNLRDLIKHLSGHPTR